MLRWVRCLGMEGDMGGAREEREEAEGDCDDEEEDDEKGLDGGERMDGDEVRETFPTGVKLLELKFALNW